MFKGKIGDINVEANGTVQVNFIDLFVPSLQLTTLESQDIMRRFQQEYPDLELDLSSPLNETSLKSRDKVRFSVVLIFPTV